MRAEVKKRTLGLLARAAALLLQARRWDRLQERREAFEEQLAARDRDAVASEESLVEALRNWTTDLEQQQVIREAFPDSDLSSAFAAASSGLPQ